MRPVRLHWAWIILTVCFFDLFVNYSVRLGYGVVLPTMIDELSLSRTAGGTIFNAYLLVYVSITPFTGFFTDRFGARRVITACALVLGAGALLMGRAQGLVSASLAFGICGLGATGMWTPVITVVQRWFATQRRGLALGILSTGYGLGFAAMGALFPVIVQAFSWRHSWYFLGWGALALLLANGLLLRSSPSVIGLRPWGGDRQAGRDQGPGRLPPGSLARVLGSRTFWLIGLSYCFMAFALYGITTFMVDFARHSLGIPAARASLLGTIHGLAQVAGVLVIMPLSDRWGRRSTMILSNAVILFCLAGVIFMGHLWLALCVLVGVLAVFYGVTWPIYGACAGDYFPKEVMGTVIGAWTPLYGGGAMGVHWLGGALRDLTGSYLPTFLISALAAGLGLALMLLVPKLAMGGADKRAKGET